MTYDECCVLAMSRTNEITRNYPSSRELMIRRASVRQRELMAKAAKANPDYYGVCAISPLDANAATDVNDIVEPTPTPELIDMVLIEDPGSSQYAAGTEVNIVRALDKHAELAPRMTLRDLVLQGVDDDMDGVISVEIYYSRLSPMATFADASSSLELQSPWDELLVIDLNRHLLQKATRLEASLRKEAIDACDAEETPLLAGYIEHIGTYGPHTTRFSRRMAR